jgi:hypothetical protein
VLAANALLVFFILVLFLLSLAFFIMPWGATSLLRQDHVAGNTTSAVSSVELLRGVFLRPSRTAVHIISSHRLTNMQNPANMSLLGNVTWAISNLCQGKPAPDMAFVAHVIEPLAALLHKEVSVDVLVDAVWMKRTKGSSGSCRPVSPQS